MENISLTHDSPDDIVLLTEHDNTMQKLLQKLGKKKKILATR